MGKLTKQSEQEKWATFLVRLSLELRKNTKLQWNDHFNRFM